MKRRWLVYASLMAALALVAAACGDDDSGGTTTSSPPTTAATTTTAAATTTTAGATTTTEGMPEVAYDTGVTPAPCADAVNDGNGCIYLGVISDLTDGPFAPLGVVLTKAQEDFWAAINDSGGLDGWDVIITAENTIDTHYDPTIHAEGALQLVDRVVGLAQTLGTPPTQAILPTLAENNMVAAPASWWSGWAFTDVESGLIMESGAPYCIEAMNGMTWLSDTRGTDVSWALVVYPGDYGGDYGAGAKIAAAQLGFADPLTEILQVPISFGGDVAPTVAELLQVQPDVIVMVTGPTEMAQITAGLFQNGFQTFMVLGAAPTWNVALKANADLMPLLEALYYSTAPWGGWDADTEGHAAMRDAAAAYGQEPHGSYVAGWTWSYPWKALLEQAIATNDLTRANLASIAPTLDGIDYQGILPERTYAGDPNDHIVRASYVNKADAAASDGLTPVTDFFTSETAANFDLAAPCFVG